MKEEKKIFYTLNADPVFKNVFHRDEKQLKNLKDDDGDCWKSKKDVSELNRDPEFYQWMTDEEDRQMMENSINIRYSKLGIKQEIE